MTLSDWIGRHWLRKVGRFLVEVAVIFVGVYAAFELDQWRADQRVEVRKHQAYEILHRLFYRFAQDLGKTHRAINDLYVEEFLNPYQQGKQPKLLPIQLGSGSITTGGWDAMLATGGLDALSIDLVYDVEVYFSMLEYLSSETQQATMLSNQYILPNLDEGTALFYLSDTGQLKQKYEWYPEKIKTLLRLTNYAAEKADSMATQLEQKIKSEGL